MPKFKFDTTPVSKVLTQLAEARKIELPEAVRDNARLLAVEFGRRTQPFGTRQEAGEARVEKDIGKIIKTEEDGPGAMIGAVTNARIKARLEQLASENRWDVVETIFRNIGFLNSWGDMEYVGAGLRQIHQRNRNPRTGRTVRKASKLFFAEAGTLQSYIAEIQRRVGMSKGGWAAAAAEINTSSRTGRFPAWVTRHQANGSATDNTNNLNEPTVTLTNSVPWVDRILPLTERIRAQQIAVAKMKKQIAKILEKAAKAAA
jgi:hypothetical protein